MKIFVWDLHGTLERGNELAVLDISNRVLEEFGYDERFNYSDAAELYGRKWREYFAWLLPNEQEARWAELQDACFKLSEMAVDLQAKRIKPTEHANEVLRAIGARHRQIILSNTRSETLRVFIHVLGIEPFFPEGTFFAIDGHTPSAVNASKNVALANFLAGHEKPEEIVIIGDSPEDMKLADVAGGVRYLYTHPEFRPRPCEADFHISDLREILERV
jgi:phosphoglycolate phosphatase-like HAD superfamily hydrolase